jgi:flavin-binding protein dodecin
MTINIMEVIKAIELVGSSPQGFDAAVRHAIEEAKRTLRNIRRVEVLDFEVLMENDEIKMYQARVKLYFMVERD